MSEEDRSSNHEFRKPIVASMRWLYTTVRAHPRLLVLFILGCAFGFSALYQAASNNAEYQRKTQRYVLHNSWLDLRYWATQNDNALPQDAMGIISERLSSFVVLPHDPKSEHDLQRGDVILGYDASVPLTSPDFAAIVFVANQEDVGGAASGYSTGCLFPRRPSFLGLEDKQPPVRPLPTVSEWQTDHPKAVYFRIRRKEDSAGE